MFIDTDLFQLTDVAQTCKPNCKIFQEKFIWEKNLMLLTNSFGFTKTKKENKTTTNLRNFDMPEESRNL
jgi:hypothetical protein